MAPRTVWIVSQVAGAKYHLSSCYVLDQVGNYDHKRKVLLEDLPEGYTPCGICAPGSRTPSGPSRAPAGKQSHSPKGIQPGAVVTVEDSATRRVSVYRIASSTVTGVSPDSPLGAALIGRQTGDVVEFQPPKGPTCKLLIRRFVRDAPH